MNKLTISIVTYNSESVIERCLDSIVKYLPLNFFKIIIYDNGSNDNTVLKIENYKIKLENLNLILIKGINNIGFGKAHNNIFSFAKTHNKSAYFLILNPDTELLDNRLITATEFLDSNNKVGLLTFKMLTPDNKLFPSLHRYPSILVLILRRAPNFIKKIFFIKKILNSYSYFEADYKNQFSIEWCSGAFLLIRSELFNNSELFDSNYFMYFEDIDLCRKINQSGLNVVYFPEGEFIHHWKQESNYKFQLKFYLFKSMIFYFKKWGLKIL